MKMRNQMLDEQNFIDRSCLVIFCKKPALLHGKQRLAATIGAEQALQFAELFLDCALEDASAWSGLVILSPASQEDQEWAGNLLIRDHRVIAQPEGSLGYRLQVIDKQLRTEGYKRVFFIGSDSPSLKPQHYKEARKALEKRDVVFCPVSDGGVAIMGARIPWPNLDLLPWSTENLGKELGRVCRQHNFSVLNITPSYDIDVEADLLKLFYDLKSDKRPARRALYSHLYNYYDRSEIEYG